MTRILIIGLVLGSTSAFVLQQQHTPCFFLSRLSSTALYDTNDADALARTKAHLEKIKANYQQSHPSLDESSPPDPLGLERERLVSEYRQQSANALKQLLTERQLPSSGRKPDLARRLAEYQLREMYGDDEAVKLVSDDKLLLEEEDWTTPSTATVRSFAGRPLSPAASAALTRAGFGRPSPIQAAALPRLYQGESLILHAETGSGKTLGYLLPITEQLWAGATSTAVILTPTRELAAQVAGVAGVLAPPSSVRLITRPTNLLTAGIKERGGLEHGLGDVEAQPRLLIGSAKAVMHSLYGDGRMPAPPTSKPQAQQFLASVQWLVLDEVDRLLAVSKSRADKQHRRRHEKPAAVVAAAVARHTLGRAQVVAASATVGRPLRRELARVLGLSPDECPAVVRGRDDNEVVEAAQMGVHVGRAVTIPTTVVNYVIGVDSSTTGALLTAAYQSIQALGPHRKMLLVLTRGFGMTTQNALGALKHFRCQPEPQSLLDALEADGTDSMIEKHRQVSGAAGVGETYFAMQTDEKGYLLVTGEDTVRGLHLDGLDVVIVVGRANGPDEYTHIAGRTGRAGQSGMVINIVSQDNAAALKSWERMLDAEFKEVSVGDLAELE